jgi:hypothetical protein
VKKDIVFYIVDTNVPLVSKNIANVSSKCLLKCNETLKNIMKTGKIALDSKWLIIKEYMKKLSPSGQPTLGDEFLKWVLTNRNNPEHCVFVDITQRKDDPDDFEEFPRNADLTNFDRSDRKFIAVCISHPEHPPILQATDRKWWQYRIALEDSGIDVKFLCPNEIELNE